MDAGHWDCSVVGEFDPSEFFGFIYEIQELPTGKAYIGKKFFKHKRKKTKSNPSRTKESDWRFYTGSCEPLNEAIQERGKDQYAFRILRLCSGRCELTYSENEIQFARDVLRARLPNGERKYYNKTIGHLLFAGVEKQTEETKEKIRRAHLGIPRPDLAERNRQGHTEQAKQRIKVSWEGDDARRDAVKQRAQALNAAQTGMRLFFGPDGKRRRFIPSQAPADYIPVR